MVAPIDPQVTQGIRWLHGHPRQIFSNFAAVVRFDTAFSATDEEISEELSNIFDSDGDTYKTESFLTGRTVAVNRYTTDSPKGVWSFFQTVRTYIRPEVEHLTDVVTIGVLCESVLHDLSSLNESRRNILRHYIQKSLNSVVEETQIISEPLTSGDRINPARSPVIFYLQPDKSLSIFSSSNDVDNDAAHQFFRANTQLLNSVGFWYSTDTFFIRTQRKGYLISPQHYRVLWGPITAIGTSFSDINDKKHEPSWLVGIRSLLPFFRRHNWALYRKKKISQYDEKTYSIGEIFSEGEEGPSEAKRNYENELAVIRDNWIELSRTTDELEYLGENPVHPIKRSANLASEDLIPPPVSNPIKRTMGLVESYRSELEDLFEELRDDITRVERKQSQIAGFLHDSVTARSTEVSLNLEKRVETLTWILTILTVVLVIDALELTDPILNLMRWLCRMLESYIKQVML